MKDIDASLNYYASTVASKGYEICALSNAPIFDEPAARAAFAQLGVVENPEYFALLRRWNGMKLRPPSTQTTGLDDAGFMYAGIDYRLDSFTSSLGNFKVIKEIFDEETPPIPMTRFQVMVNTWGDRLAFSTATGGPELYHEPRDFHYESVLLYESLSTAFRTFADAIAADITMGCCLNAYHETRLAYARIAIAHNPRAEDYWSREIDFAMSALKDAK